MLFASQLGRFVVGHSGHNIMKRPFFSFAGPNQAPLPSSLFNARSAYLYLEIFGKLTSMAATILPGRLDRLGLGSVPHSQSHFQDSSMISLFINKQSNSLQMRAKANNALGIRKDRASNNTDELRRRGRGKG